MLKTLFFKSTLESTIIYVILSYHQFTNISDHLCSLIQHNEIRGLIKNNRFSLYEARFIKLEHYHYIQINQNIQRYLRAIALQRVAM